MSPYRQQCSVAEPTECSLERKNCSHIFLSIYITLYRFLVHIAAWKMFWDIKERFLCIMLPSVNRFFNLMSAHWKHMAVNIIVSIHLVAMNVPVELDMSCILMVNIVKVSQNWVSFHVLILYNISEHPYYVTLRWFYKVRFILAFEITEYSWHR